MDRKADFDASMHSPVTLNNGSTITGPFFHGTKAVLGHGELLTPGYVSNFQQGRVSNNIYFTTRLETAVWGAELAAALYGTGERGRVYVVEPLRSLRG